MELKKAGLFEGWSNLDIARALGKWETVRLPAGAVLFRQGDLGESMYVVQDGEVELFSGGGEGAGEGNGQLLAALKAGDSFGEMALLTGEPRSATAVAAADTALYELNREAFQSLIAENPAASSYFIRLLSGRLVRTNRSLQENKASKSRLAADRLEKLPEPLADCVLHASLLPAADAGWLESAQGIGSLERALREFPLMADFFEEKTVSRDRVAVKAEWRGTLAERFTAKFGYERKQEWLRRASDHYRDAGKADLAVLLHAETGRWDAALDAVERAILLGTMDKRMEDAVFPELDRCPDELLLERSPVFDRYVRHGIAQARKNGLRKLETALDAGRERFARERLVSLYEWAADWCHALRMEKKALDYLQIAEALSGADAVSPFETEFRDERSYRLAKRQAAERRNRRRAERVGRWRGRERYAGAAAIVLSLLFLAYFHFAAPFGGLSRPAMEFVGTGLAAVVLWISGIIPDFVVALGMAAYWVVRGLVPPETALSGFASPTWLYMLFILAVGAAVAKSGLLYRLALRTLQRVPRHYRGQLLGIAAGGALLNPLIPSSSAKVSLGVPVARMLAESMGFPERGRGAAGFGLTAMVFYGFTAPFVLTGSYTNVMAYGLAGIAEPMSWFRWFWYALPAFLVFGATMLLLIFLFFKPSESGKTVSEKTLEEQLRILGKWTREEKLTLAATAGSIVLLILQPLHGIDNAWVMLLGFAALVVSGVLDAKTLKTGIDWTFLLFIGVAFSFAAVAGQLGVIDALSTFLGSKMAPFLSSPALFLVAAMAVSFLVTLLVRDDAAVILLVISFLPLAGKAGIHPWVLVFVILLATDPFFFSYQSPTYLTAYYSAEEKSFTHRQGQWTAVFYAAAVFAAVLVSVPFWSWLGLIR
ncbi:SLC13 family permease [Cohnella caldifontis]|uniref:SLC13 family permease n=1 Tax=Cohnella caldifontis TaxID=3027471 RepID=UPI0023EE023C|nr:SLC13 family permease [Cohnella sp. YIM B05605]